MTPGRIPTWSRRRLCQSALGALGALALPWPLSATERNPRSGPARVRNRPNLEVALRAAEWIASWRMETEHGVAWPWNPEEAPEKVDRSLYTGAPGVVLFLVELHDATADPAVLAELRAGADELASWIPSEPDDTPMGLYTGLAGWAFVLEEVHRVTGDARYRRAAQRAVERLRDGAAAAGRGVEWNECTDIVFGSAGIGLTLFSFAERWRDAAALETAAAAGDRLIELGEPAEGGLSWFLAPDSPRRMPNFSHGTAGVAYFLARLYEATRDDRFLDAALAGARYLQAVADHEGGGCRVFHSEPGGRNLYYLSWCHGPAGTARLFAQLHAVTGDDRWRDAVACFARGILVSGVPEQRTPGFWNNVSQCCGDAGVGEFFLALQRRTPRAEYVEMAKRAARSLLDRATADPARGGLKWVQAEHRVRPEWTVPQTGFMQGAAGIGTFFLHLDGLEQGRSPRVVWPDSPFR